MSESGSHAWHSGELRVRSGHVTALRLFDVAHKIDLPRAEELWAKRAQGPSVRSRLVGTPPKAVSFGVPPLALELGPVALTIDAEAVQAAASVRLYDFGIAAFTLRLPVQDLTWTGFSRLVNQTDHAVGPNAATEVWDELMAAVARPARRGAGAADIGAVAGGLSGRRGGCLR